MRHPHSKFSERERSNLLKLGAALKQHGYSFVTISVPSHRRVNGRPENDRAADLAGVLGWSRVFTPEVLPPGFAGLMQDAALLVAATPADANVFRSKLRVSTVGGQLFFHSAFPTTGEDAVFLGPDTYRYVQLLQRAVSARTAPSRVVDIGCGAGPGAVMLAKLLPEAEVWAVDINSDALALTELNAQLAGVAVRVAHSDLLADVPGEFDLIAANPPFMLDAGGRTYCDGGGAMGAGLSLAIVNAAISRLSETGTLVLYTCVAIVDGADPFRESAARLLGASGFHMDYAEIDPDVFGGELGREAYQRVDRIAAVELVAQRRPAA